MNDEPPAYNAEPGLYPLPDIFWRLGNENRPTTVPIDLVYIWKKVEGKNMTFQGTAYQKFFPLQDCNTLDHLLALMGPGTFMVQGRSNSVRGIIAQAWQTVGEPELIPTANAIISPSRAELDIGKVASTIVAALAPFVTVVTTWLSARSQQHEREEEVKRQQMIADRERADRMAAETMQREAERSKEFLTAITGLMSARTQDLEALLRGMQSSGGAGGGSDKAYRDGQTDLLAMLDAAKASGVLTGDTENKVLDFVQGLLAGGAKASTETDLLKQLGGLGATPPKPEGT